MSSDADDDHETNMGETRRNLLLAAGGGVGAGIASTLIGYRALDGAEHRPTDVDSVSEWDRTHDVVVAGYGAGGIPAAIEAAEAGADVLAIDKLENGGGALSYSGGVVYMGGGTPLQEALGVDDTPENMRAYLAERYPAVPEERLDSFIDGSLELYEWLTETVGVEFPEELYEEKLYVTPGGGLQYSGSENAAPYSEHADPAPRGHHAAYGDEYDNGGAQIFDRLSATAQDVGVTHLFQTEIQRLITDREEVVGVEVETDDGTEHVRAEHGVVLATGGFDQNREMVLNNNEHARHAVGGITLIEIHDGLGIQLARKVGANVTGLHQLGVSGAGVYPRTIANDGRVNHELPKGILVNGAGNRFINEDRYQGDIGQEIVMDQNGEAHLLLDDAMVTAAGDDLFDMFPLMARASVETAETLAEAADLMGVSEESLTTTVTAYNEAAANGNDPWFNKAAQYVQPLETTPYHIIDFSGHSLQLGYQTFGGLSVTTEGAVLDHDGTPIPGLYATPQAVDGIMGENMESGLSLGSAFHFGRLAGGAAANR